MSIQSKKEMDEYSERIRFLCEYKIETVSDIDKVKENKQEKLQRLLNTRNRLYYKRQKLDNESEKDSVIKEIINVTMKDSQTSVTKCKFYNIIHFRKVKLEKR